MNVGIFYSRIPKNGRADGGYLYVDHPQWRSYPHELLGAVEKYADKAVIVCKEDSYLGDNTFSHYWLPSQSEKGYFERVNATIKIGAIFNKGYFKKSSTFGMVNVPAFEMIGRNKAAQFELFGKWQPITKVSTTDRLLDAIDETPGSKVVLKPLNMNGGKGIYIINKTQSRKLVKDLPLQDWIVQQFIDSSKGVKNLMSGIHDLRVYVIDGDPALASIRSPKPGSLIANTSQGGAIKFYSTNDIPLEVLTITKQIDETLKSYGNRYYSADFITDGKAWYLLEVNDRPGVPALYQSAYINAFHAKLARSIVGSANNPHNKVQGL